MEPTETGDRYLLEASGSDNSAAEVHDNIRALLGSRGHPQFGVSDDEEGAVGGVGLQQEGPVCGVDAGLCLAAGGDGGVLARGVPGEALRGPDCGVAAAVVGVGVGGGGAAAGGFLGAAGPVPGGGVDRVGGPVGGCSADGGAGGEGGAVAAGARTQRITVNDRLSRLVDPTAPCRGDGFGR